MLEQTFEEWNNSLSHWGRGRRGPCDLCHHFRRFISFVICCDIVALWTRCCEASYSREKIERVELGIYCFTVRPLYLEMRLSTSLTALTRYKVWNVRLKGNNVTLLDLDISISFESLAFLRREPWSNLSLRLIWELFRDTLSMVTTIDNLSLAWNVWFFCWSA